VVEKRDSAERIDLRHISIVRPFPS
jgi:hypothetical protein